MLVPPTAPAGSLQQYADMADGFLFTGGLDYPPELYGQEAHPTVHEQTRERTDTDLALMRLALASPKPILGTCAGLQLMNICMGGALVQHLSTAGTHTAKHAELDAEHAVSVARGTLLHKILGKATITINSAHHQAADPDRLGKGLTVSASAPDGTIEGLELARPDGRFFLFVQWHPERILDDGHRSRVFKAFVEACK